jgi:hypothetical protein
MESGHESYEPGEIVYLLAEIGAGGMIHEIGTRATVRAVAVSGLTLELSGSSVDVACPAANVERAAERRRRAHGPRRAPLRLTTA